MPGRTESFFHGTASHISDAVRPGVQVGRSIWGRTGESAGQPSEEHAFATEDEDEAWKFAETAHQIEYGRNGYAGRARVYTVAPHPEMRPGVHHPKHPAHSEDLGELHEWVAPEYKITGRHDIQPGHQGTFPTINWRQFAHQDISGDPNHPTPDEVAEGMRFKIGSPMGKWQARREAQSGVVPNRNVVSPNQMDLFTGRTAGSYAESQKVRRDKLAEYHERRLNPVAQSNEDPDQAAHLQRQARRDERDRLRAQRRKGRK